MLRSMLWNWNSQVRGRFNLEISSQSQVYFQACFRHTAARTVTLRPLRVTSREKGRGKENMMGQNPRSSTSRRTEQLAFPEPDEYDDTGNLEHLATSISKYSSKHDALDANIDHLGKMIGKLKAHRYKTLEHKFFRKPQSPDLLTFAAKEQIRYLHELDHQEYSVQALSDLFPVSEEIIRLTVKSKVRIIRQKDILEHDQSVQKNWEDLMVSLEYGDPAVSNDVVQAFKNSQDEIVIKNATGIEDLPFHVRQTDRFYSRGEFSAIVKDCYDAKREVLKEGRGKVQAKSEEISAILSKVTEILEMKSERKTTRSKFMKLKDKKKSQINNSAAHHTEQQAVRDPHTLRPVNQERNNQDNMGTIMAQKYKDSVFNNHAKECENIKRDITRKIDVPREAQQKNSSNTYLAGDCVYDKNGEFLYRIP